MSEPKTELVLKRWRTCPNCGYRWLSESKAKDRMSCSKCKTSIMIHPKFTKRRMRDLSAQKVVDESIDNLVQKQKASMKGRTSEQMTVAMKMAVLLDKIRKLNSELKLDDIPEELMSLKEYCQAIKDVSAVAEKIVNNEFKLEALEQIMAASDDTDYRWKLERKRKKGLKRTGVPDPSSSTNPDQKHIPRSHTKHSTTLNQEDHSYAKKK